MVPRVPRVPRVPECQGAAMKRITLATLIVVLGVASALAQSEARPRARDLGLAPGVFAPGPLNAITDVTGVSVGHATLVVGDNVRTGVTVVVPHAGNVFQDKVAGAVFVGNAFGKLAGSTQVICITHLAQIAALADRHYRVIKVSGHPTETMLERLDDAGTEAELARMLGGDATAEEALVLARRMRSGMSG